LLSLISQSQLHGLEGAREA